MTSSLACYYWSTFTKYGTIPKTYAALVQWGTGVESEKYVSEAEDAELKPRLKREHGRELRCHSSLGNMIQKRQACVGMIFSATKKVGRKSHVFLEIRKSMLWNWALGFVRWYSNMHSKEVRNMIYDQISGWHLPRQAFGYFAQDQKSDIMQPWLSRREAPGF